MLGVEALGVFALGQAEPWTLKGKEKFTRRGRGKPVVYSDEPQPAPVRKLPRKKRAPIAFPPVSPEIRALLLAKIANDQARQRDDEDAIALLLMTH